MSSMSESLAGRWNDPALLIGRLCMAALFLPSGIGKAGSFAGFAKSLAGRGLSVFPEGWAAAAVAIEVVAPLLLIAGLFTRWAAVALIAFTLMATATSHRYWDYPPEQQRAQEINFYKNVAVVGGLLFLFVSGAGRWSADARRHGP